MEFMDMMLRSFDQLDEQMHSGFFTYIPTGMLNFFAYDQFNWGFSLALTGITIPVVLYSATHNSHLAKHRA